MLTISSNPHQLCEIIHRQQYMILSMIEKTIYDKIEGMPFGEERNHLAGFIGFRRETWAAESKDRKQLPWKGFLVHCASNYLSIFSKEADPIEFTGQNFRYDNWKFESSHDSCWPECMKNWLWKHEDEVTLFAWGRAVEWKTLTDEQVETIREIRKKAENERGWR